MNIFSPHGTLLHCVWIRDDKVGFTLDKLHGDLSKPLTETVAYTKPDDGVEEQLGGEHISWKGRLASSTHATPSKCTPVKNIYFVKIHKTGSTTFQNILNRFGLSHSLKFALFRCSYDMPYPHPPNLTFLGGKNFTRAGHGQRPYNILKDHAMYNREAAMEYMPEDTQVISLIRQPFSQLTSSFSFFELPKMFNMSKSVEDPVQEFLLRPEFYDKGRESYSCKPHIVMSHTQNPQAHHLGWRRYDTSEGMDQWLAKLDQELRMVSQ